MLLGLGIEVGQLKHPVTFDLPPLKVTRALIVAGGVSPSSASRMPAFPSSSLYLPIFSISLKLGTQPAFAVSYSLGIMIIMKRIVVLLEWRLERAAPFYMRASTLRAANVAVAGRVGRLYWCVEWAGLETTARREFI